MSFYDAARFSNWLATGDTEQGFYRFSGPLTLLNEGVHGDVTNESGYIAIASEDEWYKAAYHKNDGVTANYWQYATRSDAAPVIAQSTERGDVANPGSNVANYDFGADWNDSAGLGNVTTVGSAGTDSRSAYGTYDQSGNSWEWCSTLVNGNRVMRGGSLWTSAATLLSTSRSDYFPETGGSSLSFRISSRIALLPAVNGVPLQIAVSPAPAQVSGTAVLSFLSASGTDYRFDYTQDGKVWHRTHWPVAGNGQYLVIPLPPDAFSQGRCFVRAVTWQRGIVE